MSDRHYNLAFLSVHSSPLGQPGEGDTGGISIYIRELVKQLADIGHTVDIFTRSQASDLSEIVELAPGARLVNVIAGEQADVNKLQVFPATPDFARGVGSFCLKNKLKYDLIFSHYWISGIAGKFLSDKWQIPQMTMFHTLGAIKNALGIGEEEPEIRLSGERQVAADSHHIIASTETEKIALFRFYDVPPEKVSVLPCGVNTDLFKPLPKLGLRQKLGFGENPLILFVGRIERLKGLERVVMALPYLSRYNPTLIIAGEDGNRRGEVRDLKLLAIKNGVTESVVFKGLIPYEKLVEYYNVADVCVFPSYYESFGLVPLEALACGTPVVATNVGDLQNIIHDSENGYVLTDYSVLNLADKLAEVLKMSHPALRNRELIRSSVSAYSWKNIAKSMSYEFDKLLSC